MITLHRNKRPLYLCTRSIDNNISVYAKPIKLYDNYQITKTQADLETFGLDAYKYIRVIVSPENTQYYHLGDRVYIDVTPPETHDEQCKTADYEVYKPPIKTLNECEVLLKQRSGR